MSGGKIFSKIDLSNAYLQVPFHEDSTKFTTINTHQGLYQYTRLPFGVSSSPGIYQRSMDDMLRGISGGCTYLDDLLIPGKNDNEHKKTLEAVLQRLSDAGARLKRAKCVFEVPEIEYLGHLNYALGLHPTDEKVRAIKDAPAPKTLQELRSFLGMLNFYGKFITNLSTILAPLNVLL